MSERARKTISFIHRKFPLKPGMTVLDICAGGGDILSCEKFNIFFEPELLTGYSRIKAWVLTHGVFWETEMPTSLCKEEKRMYDCLFYPAFFWTDFYV